MTCRIRKWELSDARDLAAALSNPRVQDNLRDGLPYPYTEQDGTDYISAMLSADENETFAFAITADGKVIGSIGVFRQGNIHRRTAEMGYYIAEEYWGRGIAAEAVKRICEYVFENSDIIRICAEPFSHNIASCRVLEKAGFQYEGTLRNNAVKNGRVIDMKMYSLLKAEQRTRRQQTPVTIRNMTIADYDAVYALWNSCAGMGLNDLDDSRNGIDVFLKRNPDTCFVAEYDNQVVGAVMAGNDGRRGYIYHTAVHPQYRKRGIAGRLVDAAVRELKRQGIHKAALVVFDWNETGNQFWENRGFTVRNDLVYRNKEFDGMTGPER